MSKTPYFSVIVPAYNVQDVLEHGIKTLTEHQGDFEDYEIIVINDGSTDNTKLVAEKLASKDNKIKIINQENKGAGVARNVGVKNAKGEYIVFLDPDDYFSDNVLFENYQILKNYNDELNLLIYGYIIEKYKFENLITSTCKQLETKILETKEEFRQYFTEIVDNHFCNQIWTKIYKRQYLIDNKCQFNSYKQGEDLAFNIDVYMNLEKVLISNKIYYHYVRTEKETAMSVFNENQYDIDKKINNLFYKLVNYWSEEQKIDGIYRRNALNYYINTSQSFFSPKCKWNKKQKKLKIANMRREIKIQIPDMKLSDFKKKAHKIDYLAYLYFPNFLLYGYLGIRFKIMK